MPSASAQAARSALVARRFGARAAGYDEHALLQRACAQRLAAFIDGNGGLPKAGLVAEVGCGTGLLSTLLAPLAQRYLATDIAPEMAERCKAKLARLPHASCAVMDGQRPAFAEPPAGIVTNLAAQWFADPVAGLVRLAQAAPLLAFAVPLSGSFPEWRQAYTDMGREPGLLPLPEESAVRAALSALPGRRAHFETATHVIRYADARAFADSFRNIGADQPRPGYRPGPIRPVLRRFAAGMDATAFVLYGLVKEAS